MAGIGYYLFVSEKPFFPQGEEGITPPPATGNIEDAADAMLKEILDEESLLAEEEEDVILITSDSQDIASFDQSLEDDEL